MLFAIWQVMQPGYWGSHFSFDTPLRRVGWKRLGGIASGTLPPLVRYIPAWPPLAAGAGSRGASFPKQASFLPLICVCCRLQELQGLESCPCSLPSQAGSHSALSQGEGSREHGDSPSAVCRSTGVVMALLSRAAASHGGAGAGAGQQRWVWKTQRAAMMWQGGEAGRAREQCRGCSHLGAAEVHSYSSSCSSWLRAASQTSLSQELHEVGAAGHGHPALRAASVPAPPLPTMSPSWSRSSPAMAAQPAGTAPGTSRLGGSSCRAGAISHPGHATLLSRLAAFLGVQVA